MTPCAEYLPDSDVDDAIDAELRTLLSTCYAEPEGEVRLPGPTF